MKRLFGILLVLALIVVAVAVIAPFFISTDRFREPIAKAARDATGRELALKGDLSLRFFPSPRVTVTDVAFANVPGASEPQMAEMKELRVEIAILPLLSQTLKIAEFVLVEPVIHLEVDRDGKPNWQFAPTKDPEATAEKAVKTETSGGLPFKEIELGDVRIEDGSASYVNRQSGTDYHVEDIDVTLSLPSVAGPFAAEGALTYNGERVTLKANLGSVQAFLDHKPTETAITLESTHVNLAFNGQAAGATPGTALPLEGTGKAELDIASLRKFMAWVGKPMAGSEGFGPLRLAGDVQVDGNGAAFTNASLAFDDMKGTGDATLVLGGERPKLAGSLTLDKLNVTPYVGGGGSSAGGSSGGSGSPAQAGWSSSPIDLSALKAVDADVALNVGAIFFNEIKIGESALVLDLMNGLLSADLQKLALYKGTGVAKLTVDARSAVPLIASTLSFKGIDARPLLGDAIGFKRLEGLGNLDIDFATRGRSQREMIGGLDGKGALYFEDGAIYGLNIAQLVRSVASAVTELSLDRSEQKTDFAEMKGTFTIAKGVLTNPDMQLLNPLLRVNGEGQTNLLDQTVRYRIVPVAVSTLEGQGGKTDVTGLSVPILITGTWSKLRIAPDVADVGRKLLQEGLGGKSEGGEEQDFEDRLKGVLGGTKSEPAPAPAPEDGAPPAEEKTEDPLERLKDLF